MIWGCGTDLTKSRVHSLGYSLFFIAGVAYGYWGLSIGMAPILWLFMIIGTIVGFVIALKNAIRAAKALKIKE